VDVPFRGAALLLGLHERATFRLGPLRLVLRHVRPDPAPRRAWAERLDLPFLSLLVMVLCTAAVLGRMLALGGVPAFRGEDNLLRNDTTWRVRTAPPAEKPHFVVHPAPVRASGGDGRPLGDRHPVASPTPEGAARAKLRAKGVLGVLDQMRGDLARVFDSGPAPGANALANALKSLDGPRTGASSTTGVEGWGTRPGGSGGPGPFGIPGLGPGDGRGPGHGPGLGGEFGLPRRAHEPAAPPPPKPEIDCPAAREVVGNAIRRHHSEIRACYENELAHDPELRGRLSLEFDLLPDGEVSAASVHESTLGGAVEECILRRAQRWLVPLPSGCGLVHVNYPFVFERSR
jgi:hypothetical protein